MTAASAGNIPTINIEASCLPEAWEKAVVAVWDNGLQIKTQYDKPADPPSRDATVMVAVADPFAEPRIHKNFPGGPEELESYRQEVVSGIHDHWIDPAAGKWTYTYHERLFAYSPVEDIRNPKSPNRQPLERSPYPPVAGDYVDADRRPEDRRPALPSANLVQACRKCRRFFLPQYEYALAKPRPL